MWFRRTTQRSGALMPERRSSFKCCLRYCWNGYWPPHSSVYASAYLLVWSSACVRVRSHLTLRTTSKTLVEPWSGTYDTCDSHGFPERANKHAHAVLCLFTMDFEAFRHTFLFCWPTYDPSAPISFSKISQVQTLLLSGRSPSAEWMKTRDPTSMISYCCC